MKHKNVYRQFKIAGNNPLKTKNDIKLGVFCKQCLQMIQLFILNNNHRVKKDQFSMEYVLLSTKKTRHLQARMKM